VIRYASSIKLKIQLDDTQNEKIYPPYLEITYSDRKTDDILSDQATENIQFMSENFMNTTSFWSGAMTGFIVLLVAVILISLFKAYIVSKKGKLNVDRGAENVDFIASVITIFIDLFSTVFFWLMVGFTGWWFVFYKLQSRVYYLLPAIDDYSTNQEIYTDWLITLTVLKFVSMFYKIAYVQCDMDIFAIDWESPRMFHKANEYKQAVNPWRRLFVINEFSEL